MNSTRGLDGVMAHLMLKVHQHAPLSPTNCTPMSIGPRVIDCAERLQHMALPDTWLMNSRHSNSNGRNAEQQLLRRFLLPEELLSDLQLAVPHILQPARLCTGQRWNIMAGDEYPKQL